MSPDPPARRPIPRTVVLLGFASLLNDASSDILYPLLPIFLSTYVGATPVIIGLMEGSADAVASVLKLLAGRWSDRAGRRKSFVVSGYGLAGLSRILIASAGHWGVVFGARLLDRTGKGIRSAPRDALIVDVTPEDGRGRAFGLHRALDHAGAVAGPLLAAALLALGFSLRSVFVFAILPTMAGVILLFFALREPGRTSARTVVRLGRDPLSPEFRRALIPIGLFHLANSSDMFLILRAHEAGVPAVTIPLLWAGNHAVKALVATHAGAWSDRYGRVGLLAGGWLLYAAIYAAFPFARSTGAFFALFLAYGLPFALTEGSERAWVAEHLGATVRGKGFGTYHLIAGLGTLAGSAAFGVLYQGVSPVAAFVAGSALAACAALVVATMRPRGKEKS